LFGFVSISEGNAASGPRSVGLFLIKRKTIIMNNDNKNMYLHENHYSYSY